MASSINASTTAGVVTTADTSGVLDIQTAGTTAISISASQAVTFTNSPTVTGGTANGVAYLNGSKVLTTGSALVFDGTNLGVGTASPIRRLEVSTTSTGTVNLIGLGTSGAGGQGMLLGVDTTNSYAFIKNNTSSSYGMAFFSGNGSEAARFDSSGNLGIGTSSPSSRLSVAGNITLTTASPTISTALNDYLDIKATNAGGAVRIYSGNSLAIECNSAQVITLPNLAGAGTRAVNANASGTLSAASDSRLKQEVEGQTLPSLAEVMKLEVKAYKWLDDINVRGADAAIEIGFFADQVAPIIPSAAPMGRDGYYGFYDRSVIAALVNAIKEQQALITQLQADVAALKGA